MRTCLEMCAVDVTEVCSPALFNERSMQLRLRTGVAADLETGLEYGDLHWSREKGKSS